MADAGGIWPALITGIFGLLSLWWAERQRGKRRQGDADDLIARMDAGHKAEVQYLQGLIADRDKTITRLTRQITNHEGSADD